MLSLQIIFHSILHFQLKNIIYLELICNLNNFLEKNLLLYKLIQLVQENVVHQFK